MIGVCKYTYVGFIIVQFGCEEKQICSNFGCYYYLQLYNNMETLQYECATASPMDMHKGKERNEEREGMRG